MANVTNLPNRSVPEGQRSKRSRVTSVHRLRLILQRMELGITRAMIAQVNTRRVGSPAMTLGVYTASAVAQAWATGDPQPGGNGIPLDDTSVF